MESLLCNEVLPMSPSVAQEDDHPHAENPGIVYLNYSKRDCEEAIGVFLDKERRHMPELGYLNLLYCDAFISDARFKAVSWLLKCHRRMISLSTGTVFSAVNYLDRFISSDKCGGWSYYKFEMVVVACLTVASKFNETTTPPLHEFLEEGLQHSFTPSQIQKMELALLKALDWRMDCTTPFSYVAMLIHRVDSLEKTAAEDLISRLTDMLLNSLLDPKFLEFQPCVIAVSAFKCISSSNSTLIESIIPKECKSDLNRCQRLVEKQLMQDHHKISSTRGNPSSPVTVLKTEGDGFHDSRVDLHLLKMPHINVNLSAIRKRKRI